jgi:hypothetical protein
MGGGVAASESARRQSLAEDGSGRIFFVAAATVAGADLALKAALVAANGHVLFHPRSAAAVAFVCVATAILGPMILRVGSRALSLTGGILAGAGVANVASGVLWSGVPDYLAVGRTVFNLADAAAVVGGCGMILVALRLLGQRLRAS